MSNGYCPPECVDAPLFLESGQSAIAAFFEEAGCICDRFSNGFIAGIGNLYLRSAIS
jgi:hypothetical protein